MKNEKKLWNVERRLHYTRSLNEPSHLNKGFSIFCYCVKSAVKTFFYKECLNMIQRMLTLDYEKWLKCVKKLIYMCIQWVWHWSKSIFARQVYIFAKKSRACFKDHIESEKIVNYLKQRDKGAEYQSGRLLERNERYVFSF